MNINNLHMASIVRTDLQKHEHIRELHILALGRSRSNQIWNQKWGKHGVLTCTASAPVGTQARRGWGRRWLWRKGPGAAPSFLVVSAQLHSAFPGLASPSCPGGRHLLAIAAAALVVSVQLHSAFPWPYIAVVPWWSASRYCSSSPRQRTQHLIVRITKTLIMAIQW
jgi:hypothetical protein